MNFIDSIISAISPKAGFERQRYRMAEKIISEQERKYDAASGGRRTDGWKATGSSPNNEIRNSLTKLRDRSRDMVRNNPYAENAVGVIATNTVGAGIRPSIAGTGYAPKRVKKIWKDWAESKMCDYDGQHHFYGLQSLVMRTVVESGEALIRRRRVSGQEVPFKIQIVEGDLLDHSKDIIQTNSGGYIVQGVEFNSTGKRIGYWMYDRHPADGLQLVSKLIPASEIIHVYHKKRPGQVRGVPFGTASMMRLKDFDDYEDAELMRQKIAACFAVFIQDANPDAIMSASTTSGESEISERVEPGIIEHLPPGKTVTFATPPTTQGYDSYSRKILQAISAGYGVTYESLTNDLSGVNFSSGRMGWIEFQRKLTDWQENMMVSTMCNDIWGWFMEALQITGVVGKPLEVTWTPPRREMLDQVKETKGMNAAIRAGLSSWQETVRQMGYDPDLLFQELVQDAARFKEAGLILDSDARNDLPPETPTEGADKK